LSLKGLQNGERGAGALLGPGWRFFERFAFVEFEPPDVGCYEGLTALRAAR